ncbi:hypothetical protein CK203_074773 [Vitis vinifera]|uniref:Uncharacterized protein n=1 Tax=Vitis vinifera TaxID=29760 RepID=A0A438DLV0_VITVI|nr:hypothetical protein CK203_074773 [Vitis vinifera]
MEILSSNCLLIILLCFVAGVTQIDAESRTCTNRNSPCFLKRITCPSECPTSSSTNSKAKVCYINCNSPLCQAECKNRKANCNSPGAACLDPRFIGRDGIVFYFHGKRNEHFSLVSDLNLQINAHFIGLRPAGEPGTILGFKLWESLLTPTASLWRLPELWPGMMRLTI